MTPRRIQLRRTKGCANHPAPSSSPARPAEATPTAWPSTARPAPSPCTASTSRSILSWPTPRAASSPARRWPAGAHPTCPATPTCSWRSPTPGTNPKGPNPMQRRCNAHCRTTGQPCRNPPMVQRSDSAQPSRNPATSGAALSGTLTILVRLVAPLTRTTSRTPNPERRSERGEGCGGGVLTHRTTRAPSRTGRLLLDASRAGFAPPCARGAPALSPRRREPRRRGGAPARSPRAGRRTAPGAARGASSPASTVACRSTGSS